MIHLSSAEETLNIAARLAQHCPHPFIMFLQGPLGAGKTTFTRGFLQGLGFQGNVKSPTYTLVEPYTLPNITLYHFDLYRLRHPTELLDLGLDDYTSQNCICIFEWPEQGGEFMPTPDLTCRLSLDNDARLLELLSHNERADNLMKELL